MALDWSKIDTWEKFQRLTNALFCSEINDHGFFQPSSPYIGADGGWDGRHQGTYSPEGTDGLFSIQAKFTNKSHQSAFNYLKSTLLGTASIKGEIKKAEENKVDHLRISTNAELKVDQVNELEKLANGFQLKSLKIWYREQLSQRISRDPFICHYFFGNPQFPAFVPTSVYFSEIEKGITPFSYLEIPKFKEYLLKFQEFVTSDSKHVLLVYGPGGHGKSHLLREISNNSDKFDSHRKILFFRPTRDPQEAFADELIAGNKYLLVFDDAERNLEEVEKILKSVSADALDVKLILSFRIAGYPLITKTVVGQKFRSEPAEIKVGHWSKEELTHLLRMTSEKDEIKDVEEIVKQFPNPYLIVLMGNKIKDNPLISRDDLKGKILLDLKHDVSVALSEELDQSANLLFTLACLVPFWPDNKEIVRRIAVTAKRDNDSFEKGVQNLVSAGVLRKVGRTVRFDPDMKGDMFLADYISKKSYEEIKSTILELIEISPENVFSNIGSAFLDEEEKNVVEKILSELVREWISDSSATSTSEKRKRLQMISRIGFLVPDDALNLISTYLDENQPTDGYLSTDDFGPAILHLTRSSVTKNTDDILNCIRKLVRNARIGTYDNYKPRRITERAFSPVFQDIQTIDGRLDVLDQWANENDDKNPSILSDALSEVLGSTHEFDRSYSNKIEFGERFVLDRPDTRALRGKALLIVEKMLKSSNSLMVEAGVEVVREIGRAHRGNISGKDVPLSDCFPIERARVIEVIKDRIRLEKDFKVLNDFEDLLMVWWAQQIDGVNEEDLANILKIIPHSSEYLLLRHVYSHEYVVEDIEQVLKIAPTTERWSWFVHNVMSVRWNRQPQEFQELVKDVSTRLNSPERITEYLERIGKILPTNGHVPRPIFIYSWVGIDQKSFSKIRNDSALWPRIPAIFQYEIDGALAEQDPDHIRKIRDEIIPILPDVPVNKTSQLVYLANKLDFEEQAAIVKAIAQKGSSWSRGQLMMDLYGIYQSRKDLVPIIDLAIFVLENGSPEERVLDNLAFLLHSLKDVMDKAPEKKSELCKSTICVLKEIPRLSWHENELLGYCTEDFEDLISLVLYRLEKSKTERLSIHYEAIPFDGLKIIAERISSYDQFKSMMDKLSSMMDEEEGISSYEVRHLIEPVSTKKNELSGNYYLVDYIKELLSRNQTKQAIEMARYLSLSAETSELILEISADGIATGLIDEVRSLLFSKTNPEGGYSFTPGEPPPILLSIKSQFDSLVQKVPAGKLKAILNDCLQYVTNSIENHKLEDEED